jgi:hypothetical protein
LEGEGEIKRFRSLTSQQIMPTAFIRVGSIKPEEDTMRIAYLTIDEVNLARAVKLADRWGGTISLVRPGDQTATTGFDAVLHDLDVVPRQQRNALLEDFYDNPPARPTAVHGYGLTDEQAETLHRHGVVVAQRLHAGLVRSLCRAIRRSRVIVHAVDTPTWINLAE